MMSPGKLLLAAMSAAIALSAATSQAIIVINADELWDGIANPRAADGVLLDAATRTYTIPTGITIGAGVTVRVDHPDPAPGDPPSDSITWNFTPGAGGLTFTDATSTIDISPGIRNRFPAVPFTLNMANNNIGGLADGAGRIINGVFVNGGNTGDTMRVVINSDANVVLGAVDIRVNDAASGSINITAGGLVDIDKLANADVSAGGGSTQPINVTGETLVLGELDTRTFRLEGSVGNINLRALGQPENNPGNPLPNTAATNSITLNGAVKTNGPPASMTPGGNLNLTAAKVTLGPGFSIDLHETGDFNVTTGITGANFTQAQLFMNNSAVTPDTLNFTVLHDNVPEPTSVLLAMLAALALGATRRRA